MIDFLKAQPDRPVILKSAEITERYHYWRLHIMLTMYGGYAWLFCMRKSLNHVMPAVMVDQGLDLSDIGLMGTLFYTVYGCSKFISGMASDQANPRYFMGLGILISGLANVLLGFSNSMVSFTCLIVVSACFHGWGWPPCARLLTSWYSQSERGVWWSCWNTAHNVGAALSTLIVGYIAMYYGWREALVVIGLLGMIAGIMVCWRLRDKPATMSLPSVGAWGQDPLEQQQENTEPDLNYQVILSVYVLKNQYIWLLAVSYVLVYIVRIAVSDWVNLYFVQAHHYDLVSANSILFIFEVGGFLGSLVAGWGSDKLFGGNRGPMNLLFALGVFLSVVALWLMPVFSFVLQASCVFAIGFFVFGPQMLIGMAAAECSHKAAVGAATGLLGLFAYLGAALAGYPMALVIEHYQWTGFFIVLTVVSAVIGLLLLPFFLAQVPDQVAVD